MPIRRWYRGSEKNTGYHSRNWINEKYELSSDIYELLGRGAVLSFRTGVVDRRTSFKDDIINFIEVPETDEFGLILKTVNEIKDDIIQRRDFYLEFGAFKWVDRESGYEIKSINENEEASLNFFLTIIIPLLIDDIDTLQGVLTLVLIVVIIAVLLYRTKLFYANPVLTFLGYHFYEFEFKENADEEGTCIGICQGEIVHTDVIEYKKITGNVFYVKEQL